MTDTLTRTVHQQYLLDTADDIETHGHYQGQSDLMGEPVCVVSNHRTFGGFNHAAWEARSGAYTMLAAHLGLTGNAVAEIIAWNDSTPAAEVVATLRQVGSA